MEFQKLVLKSLLVIMKILVAEKHNYMHKDDLDIMLELAKETK